MAIKRPFTSEETAMLGMDADWRVADRLGRSRDSVRRERTRLGIPPYGNPRILGRGAWSMKRKKPKKQPEGE